MRVLQLWAAAVLCLPGLRAENAAQPGEGPQLDPATLHSLGAWWIVKGDDNANAAVTCHFRKAGAQEWREGLPLFRVEKGMHLGRKNDNKTLTKVPDDAWLFAGSLLLLEPDTAYEWKLALKDPDGGEQEQILRARTIAEPRAPADLKIIYVAPGAGGGSGTSEDPYKGLAAAQEAAHPGTLLLLNSGVYEGKFEVAKSGAPGKPIIYRGAAGGAAVLDGKSGAEKRADRGISAIEIHDVWFENLTIRNADYGIVAHDSARLVVRRCHIHNVEFGLTWTRNSKDRTRDFFISDNIIEGPSVWPRTKEKGIENARGIQATGAGHVICYNRIRGFADAIDTFGSQRCQAIDIHNNDVGELTDDGIEMDYSERNTRCFYNRLTNVYQGISTQPVFGGPVYIFRNAMYNVEVETFKIHNGPSGVLLFHNTSVKQGEPLVVWTGEKFSNFRSRNNLFIGAKGRAFDCSPMAEGSDYDFDGFGGFSGEVFLKWNNVKYANLEEVRSKGLIYRHLTVVDPATAFASGLQPPADVKQQQDWKLNDLRLKAGTAALDAGEALPGINDGFVGKAPDLGAYEFGQPLPHYGPRPASK